MKIQDNRNIDCPLTVSDICRVEYCNDNLCRVILYSGFAVYIDRVEYERITLVMSPRKEEAK
jgi:hypothetical protein